MSYGSSNAPPRIQKHARGFGIPPCHRKQTIRLGVFQALPGLEECHSPFHPFISNKPGVMPMHSGAVQLVSTETTVPVYQTVAAALDHRLPRDHR